MKLLICLVTFNRLEYTKRTIQNLRNSVGDDTDYYLIISDNNSTDGTRKYIKSLYKRGIINDYLFNPVNFYPGKACNLGWEKALKDYKATHLMRLDNDMELTEGWNKRVEEYFKAIPELGQLGIEHEAIETPEADLRRRSINGFTINEWPGCVGGPMIMPIELWRRGVRYDETPWHTDDLYVPLPQEDSKLSQQIKNLGYIVGHAQEELGRTFATKATWSDYPEYYTKTMTERGYGENLKYIKDTK